MPAGASRTRPKLPRRRPDRYGALLVLILVDCVAIFTASSSGVGRWLPGVLVAATVILGLETSAVEGRWVSPARALAALAVVAAVADGAVGTDTTRAWLWVASGASPGHPGPGHRQPSGAPPARQRTDRPGRRVHLRALRPDLRARRVSNGSASFFNFRICTVLLSRIATWARTRRTGSRSGSSPRWRGTPCSPGTCSSPCTGRRSRATSPDSPSSSEKGAEDFRLPAPRWTAREEDEKVFILIHFGRKEVLIGGTLYAGEIKKSIFTVMNFLLPAAGVLPMHCAASYGRDDQDVTVLFGLSGTGKTTLSADPERTLVGDDEHGWSDRGVFDFEGGCYAKVINLSPGMEPEIHRTTGMFGTILENVGMDIEARRIDLNDATLTENTRASYPLSYIPGVAPHGAVGHPKHIVMLTADASGCFRRSPR